MELMTILEQMAGKVHHQIDFTKLLDKQIAEIKNAFAQKNSTLLRDLIAGSELLADRSTVTQF